jgi:radical SAM protein with 4Fe4S-binding SPASM domain
VLGRFSRTRTETGSNSNARGINFYLPRKIEHFVATLVISSEISPSQLVVFAGFCASESARLVIRADSLSGLFDKVASIRPEGDVTPCVMLPIVVNTRQWLAAIWHSSTIIETSQDRSILKGWCHSCLYQDKCGGLATHNRRYARCRSRCYLFAK